VGPRYTGTAIALHWLMAALIFAAVPVAIYMVDLPLSPWKLKVYSWHKWIGVTVFLLALVRLGWRWTHPAPALPRAMPAWEKTAAGVSHALLYLLLLAIPLSGWLMSSALGFQTVYFGVLPIPDLLAKEKELGEFLKLVHLGLNLTLGGLLLAHVGAALKHHYFEKDDVLTRMLPAGKRKKEKDDDELAHLGHC
jgi:cytochrome b561